MKKNQQNNSSNSLKKKAEFVRKKNRRAGTGVEFSDNNPELKISFFFGGGAGEEKSAEQCPLVWCPA